MNNCTQINVIVTGQSIQLANNPVIASGGVNSVKINFVFCGQWDGLGKTAVFYRDAQTPYKVVLVEDSALVPTEILAESGSFKFGVYGTDGDRVFPSILVSMAVAEGSAALHAVDPEESAPDIYNQLLAAYGKQEAALAVEKARINELVALRGSGTVTEYPLSGKNGMIGTIKTNGFFATIYIETAYLEWGLNTYTAFVPAAVAPMGTVKLECETEKVNIGISPPVDELDGASTMTIYCTANAEGGPYEELVEAHATYQLANIAIPEVSDIRVGLDGTVYPTAGEAVRLGMKKHTQEQIEKTEAKDVVIQFNEELDAWGPGLGYSQLRSRYLYNGLRTLRLRNDAEGYECTATKIELTENEDFDIYTAVGVFRYTAGGVFSKIADPESGGGSVEGAVLYTEQTLPPERKAQARANVDAVGTDDIFEGIPTSNLLDASTAKIGLLNADGNIYTGSSSYDAYTYYEQYIPVSEGDEITHQYDRGGVRMWSKNTGNTEYRWARVVAYDANKNVLPSLGVTAKSSSPIYSYVVPATVSYIRVTRQNNRDDFYTNHALLKNATAIVPYEPYGETYAIKKSLLPESDTDKQVLAYLPAEICVAVGRTIEIYNSQVCPNADKYHFRWNCNVGKALKRKFSITGTEALAGDYTLSLEIYDDSLDVVWSGTTTLKITANTIANDVTICTIGDSLTNNKYWLNELRTLSANKIVHVGTRGATDGLKHEGRSGFSANAYLKATEYSFESEGVHPFWDAENSCFSWEHYKTNYGINPTAVQIFLGTNDLAAESISAEDFVEDMQEIVNAIRTADSTIPIFVVHTICWGNQNGIGNQTSSDGFASQKGRFKYGLDYKIIKASELLYAALKDCANVYFVPLTQCHDSEYNFGGVETPVNPRASQTEMIPTEGVHPQQQGYEQMADIMYSVICAKLG